MVGVKNASGYEIRLYGAATESEFWSTAVVEGDFSAADSEGFDKNFKFITGANKEKVDIPMTHPVIQRFNDSDANHRKVSFFVPSNFSSSASSVPQPTDPDVSIERMPLARFAISEFPGFATENDFVNCEASLRKALEADGVKTVSGTNWSRAWAQYDSPFTLFDRHNECWLQVE